MSLILNIDSALETASVCLALNGDVIFASSNEEQKDHATWLHPAVAELMLHTGKTFHDLDAVAVSMGPGSYTGLRVGLAAAKGFCYALKLPLITVNTLAILANSVKEEAVEYIAALIDARRMEVFAAVYDKEMIEVMAPLAMILQENSFGSILVSHKVLFCGSGSKKIQTVLSHSNASRIDTGKTFNSLAKLSYTCFLQRLFADIAYAEPLYLKDFHYSA